MLSIFAFAKFVFSRFASLKSALVSVDPLKLLPLKSAPKKFLFSKSITEKSLFLRSGPGTNFSVLIACKSFGFSFSIFFSRRMGIIRSEIFSATIELPRLPT